MKKVLVSLSLSQYVDEIRGDVKKAWQLPEIQKHIIEILQATRNNSTFDIISPKGEIVTFGLPKEKVCVQKAK